MASSINASTSGAGGLITTADNTGNLNIQSGGSTVLALTSSGTTVTGTGSYSGNLSFNSGYGSAAVAYGCRAWVNFNGTGTVAIRASGNVTSITDNAVGDYTVNFTNAMPDNNYAVIQGVNDDPGSFGVNIFTEQGNGSSYGTKTTTSSVRIRSGQNLSSAYVDCGVINIGIFR